MAVTTSDEAVGEINAIIEELNFNGGRDAEFGKRLTAAMKVIEPILKDSDYERIGGVD